MFLRRLTFEIEHISPVFNPLFGNAQQRRHPAGYVPLLEPTAVLFVAGQLIFHGQPFHHIPLDVRLACAAYPPVPCRSCRLTILRVKKVPVRRNCGAAIRFDQKFVGPAAAELVPIPHGIGIAVVAIGAVLLIIFIAEVFLREFFVGGPHPLDGVLRHQLQLFGLFAPSAVMQGAAVSLINFSTVDQKLVVELPVVGSTNPPVREPDACHCTGLVSLNDFFLCVYELQIARIRRSLFIGFQQGVQRILHRYAELSSLHVQHLLSPCNLSGICRRSRKHADLPCRTASFPVMELACAAFIDLPTGNLETSGKSWVICLADPSIRKSDIDSLRHDHRL